MDENRGEGQKKELIYYIKVCSISISRISTYVVYLFFWAILHFFKGKCLIYLGDLHKEEKFEINTFNSFRVDVQFDLLFIQGLTFCCDLL